MFSLRDNRGSLIYIRGFTPLDAPSGKMFVPEASTLPHLIVFLYFNFLALAVSEILGVPNLH